jgi:hypothetical protein
VSIVRAVEEEMARLASSLPDGVAKLAIEPGDTALSKDLILSPSNPAAAPIHIHVDHESDVIWVTIGRGAVFEVPREGHRYSDLAYLDEVRAICFAAIRGEVEETVWFKGEDVVGGTAKAKIGSRETGDSWRQLFTNPLRHRTKKSFTYEPYI